MPLSNQIIKLLEDPKNRQIVNKGQDYFDIHYIDGIIYFTIGMEEETLDEHYEFFGFMIIRHCIALLPCFDVPNPRYEATMFYINNSNGTFLFQDNLFINKEDAYQTGLRYGKTYTTIRKALLSAPVLTVAELDEYAEKNNLKLNV